MYEAEGRRVLEKELPYLNLDTGLKNRMVSSDPLTGLGILSSEWNPLSGSHMLRKTLPHRDPIRMQGDLGQEFNCLYTTKELQTKPREAERDPIAGTGDFGREWDPIHKYAGRTKRMNRSITQTDPITHTNSNRETLAGNSAKQYNERYFRRDPILHIYESPSESSQQSKPHEMRHYNAIQRTVDPITHMPTKYGGATSGSNTSSRGSSGRRAGPNSSVSSSQEWSRGVRARGMYNPDSVQRNPITGVGMKPTDYKDLVNVPRHYQFRSQHVTDGKPGKSTSTERRAVSSSPRRAVSMREPAKSTKAKANTPPPPENKAIRPKRISKPAPTENGGTTLEVSTPEKSTQEVSSTLPSMPASASSMNEGTLEDAPTPDESVPYSPVEHDEPSKQTNESDNTISNGEMNCAEETKTDTLEESAPYSPPADTSIIDNGPIETDQIEREPGSISSSHDTPQPKVTPEPADDALQASDNEY